MISGFLLKVVIGIALVGFVAIEGGSPLITRAQVDGAAHDAATDAAAEFFQSRNPDRARAVAEEIAAKEETVLEAFEIDEQGLVKVTMFKQARSVLLKKWSATKSWYEIKVSATAQKK